MGTDDIVKWGNWSVIGDYSQTLQNRFKDFYLANLQINLMAFELNATAQAIVVEAEANSNPNDPKIVRIINGLNSYSNIIVSNNLNQQINNDYLDIMTNLNEMETLSRNLSVESLIADIQDIPQDALLNVEHFIHNFNHDLSLLVNYTRNKVETFGECKSIYNAFTTTRDFVCIDLATPLNQYWLPLGWGSLILILTLAFALKFKSLLDD